MPLDITEISFGGENGTECEEFIRQVYAEAWKEGYTQDSTRIANFVSMCFRGKALRWYVKLPLEMRRDWESLQLALLEQWPSEDDTATPSAAAAAAAAAAPPPVSPSFSYKIGRLKAKLDANDVAHWVSTGILGGATSSGNGCFVLTSDPERALHVQLVPLPDRLWRLKMLNHSSGYNFVAMYIPGTWKSSYGILVGADTPQGSSIREHRSTYSGPANSFEFKSDVWTFSVQDRTLSIQPEAANKPGGYIYTMMKMTDKTLLLNDGPTLPSGATRAKLSFEPLDL